MHDETEASPIKKQPKSKAREAGQRNKSQIGTRDRETETDNMRSCDSGYRAMYFWIVTVDFDQLKVNCESCQSDIADLRDSGESDIADLRDSEAAGMRC